MLYAPLIAPDVDGQTHRAWPLLFLSGCRKCSLKSVSIGYFKVLIKFVSQILDEVHSILNYISITPRLQRPYRVTDELFDLSTMAMEYFKDRIEPTLPGLAYFNKDFFQLPATTKRRKFWFCKLKSF